MKIRDHIAEVFRERLHRARCLVVYDPDGRYREIALGFCGYLPGWEMPKSSSAYLTDRFGFITDYLAEAFHHLFRHSNRYEQVSGRVRLGAAVEGRDEKGINKTIAGLLKILHPGDDPSDEELEEYTRYAVEARRRVKEQMNKRKPDDEFVGIDLSYLRPDGREVVVFCPESRNAPATLSPSRRPARRAGSPPPASRSAT